MKGIYALILIEIVIFKYMITMPFMSETRIKLIITRAGIIPIDKKLQMGKRRSCPMVKRANFTI